MKRLCTPIAPILAVILAAALQGQTRSRIATGLDDITAAKLKADLYFLASDAMQGRMSLEPGDDAAIQWIASEFSKAGLKPLVGDSFFQPVPLVEYRMDRERTVLTVRSKGATKEFKAPALLGGYPNDGVFQGQVVFAGFGITAPELGYDDYAGIDAKGKIVLVFNHEPQEYDANSVFNGKGNTRYANLRAKMTNAWKHGAAAVLMAPDPNHKPGNERGSLDAGGRGAQFRTPRPVQAIDGDESIPALTVTAEVAAELLASTGKTGSELQSAIDSTLKPQSRALAGVAASLRIATSNRKRGVSQNVIGMIEGSNPTLKAETILVSAHHDHDGTRVDGEIYRGADDNGSGTVGVVSMARALAKNPVKPKRSIVLAVFAAEERGLLGAYYYASHPLRPLASTKAQINFDMIGRDEKDSNQTHGLIDIAADTSNEVNIIGTRYSPDYKAAVVRSNELVGLHLNYKWDDDTILSVLFRSDQYPMLMHDIPAVWWFTGFHPDYHQVTDTAEKINYPKMEKIVRLAYATCFDFGDAVAGPKFFPAGAAK